MKTKAPRPEARPVLAHQHLRRVALQRIDTSHNHWRYYAVWIRPDLFAPAVVVCQWGRIGYTGRWLTQAYTSWSEAEQSVARIARQKIQRGYVLKAIERGTPSGDAETG